MSNNSNDVCFIDALEKRCSVKLDRALPGYKLLILPTYQRSTFIEQQVAEYHVGTNSMPCYFYCARNLAEPERADPAAIFRSLVRQMSCIPCNGVILDPVQKVYKARKTDGFAAGPLTMSESKALIIELTQSRPLTTIVIDALDECDPVLRGELFDALTDILQSSNGLVKILVSSRNERDIICELNGCLNLEIEAKNNQADITHFVNHEVDDLIRKKRLLSGNVPDDLRKTIKQALHVFRGKCNTRGYAILGLGLDYFSAYKKSISFPSLI